MTAPSSAAATSTLTDRVRALLAAINHDDGANGGLLSRETIRKADETRIALANMERDWKAAAPTRAAYVLVNSAPAGRLASETYALLEASAELEFAKGDRRVGDAIRTLLAWHDRINETPAPQAQQLERGRVVPPTETSSEPASARRA